MKKLLLLSAVLFGAVAASQAGGLDVHVGIGIPLPGAIVIGRPGPVVVHPPVYAPAPVYVPPPVCAPAPVVVVPPRRVVYRYPYWYARHHSHGHGHGHGHYRH